MHKFIINSNNILHKNYLIRINERFKPNTINFVSYENLITAVKRTIKYNYTSTSSPCFGNWTDDFWYCEGLHCHTYHENLKYRKRHISKYISLIDEIHQYDTFVMDEFWFFVCLVHFADPVDFKSLDFHYWDYSWLKTKLLSEMFERNNIQDGMDRFFEEGKNNEYILEVKEDGCKLNKEKLFNLFLNSLLSIEASFKKYEKAQFELLNESSYVVTINGCDFQCFKDKIMFSKDEMLYFTQFHDLNAITQLPKEQRELEIYNQFMKNSRQSVKDFKLIESLVSKELTGQITVFYLKQLLTNDNAKHFTYDLHSSLERELRAKNYMEDYIQRIKRKFFNIFTDKIIKDVSSISNNDF